MSELAQITVGKGRNPTKQRKEYGGRTSKLLPEGEGLQTDIAVRTTADASFPIACNHAAGSSISCQNTRVLIYSLFAGHGDSQANVLYQLCGRNLHWQRHFADWWRKWPQGSTSWTFTSQALFAKRLRCTAIGCSYRPVSVLLTAASTTTGFQCCVELQYLFNVPEGFARLVLEHKVRPSHNLRAGFVTQLLPHTAVFHLVLPFVCDYPNHADCSVCGYPEHIVQVEAASVVHMPLSHPLVLQTLCLCMLHLALGTMHATMTFDRD